MLGFVKKLLISYLARSEDPRLRALGGWINDAEQKAIDSILAIITDSVKNEGRITPVTAEKILGVSSQPSDPASVPAHPPRTFLEQYLEFFRVVTSFGSLGKAIWLQGFLHSSECSSLWLFEDKKTPEVRIGTVTGPDEIVYLNFEILIGKKLDDAEFRSQNRQIGNNYTTWHQQVDRRSMLVLAGVYEDYIELNRTLVEPANRRRQRETTVKEQVPFDERDKGVNSMAESLPIAMEERGSSLASLGKVLTR
jgi:hypothetical protein